MVKKDVVEKCIKRGGWVYIFINMSMWLDYGNGWSGECEWINLRKCFLLKLWSNIRVLYLKLWIYIVKIEMSGKILCKKYW